MHTDAIGNSFDLYGCDVCVCETKPTLCVNMHSTEGIVLISKNSNTIAAHFPLRGARIAVSGGLAVLYNNGRGVQDQLYLEGLRGNCLV